MDEKLDQMLDRVIDWLKQGMLDWRPNANAQVSTATGNRKTCKESEKERCPDVARLFGIHAANVSRLLQQDLKIDSLTVLSVPLLPKPMLSRMSYPAPQRFPLGSAAISFNHVNLFAARRNCNCEVQL